MPRWLGESLHLTFAAYPHVIDGSQRGSRNVDGIVVFGVVVGEEDRERERFALSICEAFQNTRYSCLQYCQIPGTNACKLGAYSKILLP